MTVHCICCNDEFVLKDGMNADFMTCPACGTFGSLVEVEEDEFEDQ